MKNIFVDLELKVCDLIDFQNKCWNIDKLQELFFEENISRILEMKTIFDQEDYWVWLHNKKWVLHCEIWILVYQQFGKKRGDQRSRSSSFFK